ncbi:hypothetical protein [Nodosilinea sp. P-1105]|uniref:hypothetical protein n=1 Tax=Nodosilinea sp. P-1105 TaxID=2546229 RepID=UPI0019801A66|nr:hypothetical protein [Nodosilinea sp. P-1105]
MNQEDTRDTATLPLDEAVVDPDTLVSTYADSLISGLFEDVDKLLDGDEAALAAVETISTPNTTAIDVAAESTVEDSTLGTDGDTADSLDPADTSLVTTTGDLDFFASADGAQTTPPAPPAKTRLGKFFDRLLLATTALSLLGMAAFLWISQQRLDNGASVTQTPVPASSTGQSDAEFLAYLQRSLEVVAGKVERGEIGQGTSSTDMVPPGALPPMLPPTGVSNPANGAVSGPVNVIERVYIPYQTDQAPSPQQPVPIAPIPQPVPPQATTQVPSQPTAPAAAAHVLVGVLELGSRSAALFEINGVSQRVYIGERVGSSGWTLVSVSNEEAVIRRNGEVRSIYIGQRF